MGPLLYNQQFYSLIYSWLFCHVDCQEFVPPAYWNSYLLFSPFICSSLAHHTTLLLFTGKCLKQSCSEVDRCKFKSRFRVTMGKFPSLSFFLCKRTTTYFLSLSTFHSLVSKCEEITFQLVLNSLIHNSLQLWIITPTDLAIGLVLRNLVLCNT